VSGETNPRLSFGAASLAMALVGFIGAPQIAALLVLAQRGLEELYSARNTKALLAQGGARRGALSIPSSLPPTSPGSHHCFF